MLRYCSVLLGTARYCLGLLGTARYCAETAKSPWAGAGVQAREADELPASTGLHWVTIGGGACEGAHEAWVTYECR